LSASFWRTPKAVFLVDDDEAQALELDVLLQQLVGADDDVDLAVGQPLMASACSLAVLKRDSSATLTGQSAKRSTKVW
jgi:hypothetical protein